MRPKIRIQLTGEYFKWKTKRAVTMVRMPLDIANYKITNDGIVHYKHVSLRHIQHLPIYIYIGRVVSVSVHCGHGHLLYISTQYIDYHTYSATMRHADTLPLYMYLHSHCLWWTC